jgi:PAS domain S-box-containing protein
MSRTARLWLVVVPIALVAGGVAFAFGLTSDHGNTPSPAILVVELTVGWSFIAAGLVARTRRPENRTGLLLIAVGFAWLLNGLNYSNSSFLWTLGMALSAVWAAFFVHALLAYPSGLITSSRQRALVVFGYGLASTANIAGALFDPDPSTCSDCPSNALLITDNQTAADAILTVVQILGAAFLIWVAVEIIRRWRGSTPAGRRLLGPVLLVGGLTIALLGASLGLQTVSQLAADITNTLAALAFLTVPYLFLWGILRTRLARSDVGRLLAATAGQHTPDEAQENLRHALHDPTLDLLFWLGERETYVGVDGQPYELPHDDPARAVTPIAYGDRPVGALVHDPSLLDEPELMEAFVAAARLAIERDRLQAELLARLDELQRERDFVRDVVNAAPSYFIVADEEGLVVRFNHTLQAATGLADDGFTRGKPWWEPFAVRDDIAALRDWFLAAREEDQPSTHEARMAGRDEQLVTAWSLARVRDESGSLRYLLSGLDLTERVRQEQELASSERRSRALLAAMPDAMVRLKLDGTVVDWHADPKHIQIDQPANFIGSNLYDDVEPEREERIRAAAARALETGELQTVEYDIDIQGERRNREGRIVAAGEDEVFLIVRDITERKRTLGALETSERRSRALLEGVPDNIYRVARDGHRFLDIRWADPTRLPVPQERFIGGTVYDLGLPGDLADRFIAAAERAFATGGVQSLEYEVPLEGGETIHLEARVVPSGDTEYFVLVRDVSDRKRAQLALEENERRSRALLAGIPDNIFRVRRADNRFIDVRWSRPARLPIPQEQVVGSTIYEIGMPEDVAARIVAAADRAFASGEVQTIEYELQPADGSETQYLETRVVASGDEYFGVVRDVSDRKRALQALEASERRSTALLAGIPDNIFRAAAADHRITDVSWGRESRLPIPNDAVVGSTMYELGLPEAVADQIHAAAESALATGELQEIEFELDYGGGRSHLEARVVPSGADEFYVTVRDVTDRKRAELDLENQRDYLSAIGDATPSTLIILRADGSIGRDAINVAGRVLTGFQPEDAEGRLFWELLAAPEDADQTRDVIAEVVSTGVPREVETQWVTKSGERHLIAWSCTPLPEQGGTPLYLVSGVDVTDRARQEKEQAALRRVAVAVASERRVEQIFDLVTEEVGRLLDADSANVVRVGPDGKTGVIVGRWSEPGVHAEEVGTEVRMLGGPANQAIDTGRPVRADLGEDTPEPLATRFREQGMSSVVAAPIIVAGKVWGAVSASLTAPKIFPPGMEVRVGEFTRLVSLAIANEEARDQLAASRARIVEAGDAERRRLERNLHDGAQQRLVSLSLSLRLAQARLRSDPEAATQLLSAAGAELALALEELRELARGIHPAVLTDRGLGPALESLAGRAPLPVDVLSVPEERLPGPVEAAAFYVVSEALANVAKYAEATSVSVSVARENGRAVVEVADDGKGGADPTKGSGLRGLLDRVEALEGVLAVDSPPGAGTRVRAEIPLTQ